MTNLIAYSLPPFGEIRVEGRENFALVEGNAPWVFVRIGSDVIRVQTGNSVPVADMYCHLVNPFPRPIEVTILRGAPLMIAPNPTWSVIAANNLMSGASKYRAATVTGLKFAIGVMLKRGTASVDFYESTGDGFSKVMIFDGAKPNFISFKPAGCMEEGISMIFADGKADDAIYSISGTYSQAMVDAWIAAAGYTGNVIERPNYSGMNGVSRYTASTDRAVFFVRDVDKSVQSYCRVTHLGDGLEAFR